MSNGILKKILKIQETLEVKKTGWDERDEYAYYKAEDVATAVRGAMTEYGVIHRTRITDWHEDNFFDKSGRNRPRLSFIADVIFTDVEDGSEFVTSVVATGSDTGGDKAARKAGVQAFKIAAVDVFLITEETEKFDSDNDPEAPPVNMSDDKDAPAPETVASLMERIGAIVKDGDNPIEGSHVNAVGNRLAAEAGIAQKQSVWKKNLPVMQGIVKALEAGEIE